MATGAIGIASFIYIATQLASETGFFAVGGIVFSLAVFGLISGIYLWQRFYWALTASVIYFSLQLVAIESPQFTFSLYSGIHFFISITQGESLYAFNVFALTMIFLTLRAKNELRKTNA